jgi:TraK protein
VKHFYFLTLSFFFKISIFAVIFSEIDTTQSLQCTFSLRHPNRIMIEKQTVERVIHTEPESIQILIEEKSGQAFVMAKETIDQPVTLCMVTSDGEVQNIEVTFKDIPSELIIFQNQRFIEQEEICSEQPCSIEALINSILTHQIPSGYCEQTFESPIYKCRRKIFIKEMRRLESEEEVLRVFYIANCSRRQVMICEKELTFPNASWVYLEKHKLLSSEVITAIVAMKKW